MEENTIQEQNINEVESVVTKPHRHTRPEKERDTFFFLRQIFNIVFMVGAVVGCILYMKVNELMGGILIIIAMAFKMAECVLRFRKK